MHEFNQSLRYDQRMWKVDIAGSIAYSKALHKTGILTKEEQEKIADGLTAVGREWEQGTVSALFVCCTSLWFSNFDAVDFSLRLCLTMRISTLLTNVV